MAIRPLTVVLLAVNVLAAVVTVYDKAIAGKRRRRIPEQTLFLLAALGGAPAMYLTMLFVRHKTRHRRFMLGLPLLLAAQLVAYFYILA